MFGGTGDTKRVDGTDGSSAGSGGGGGGGLTNPLTSDLDTANFNVGPVGVLDTVTLNAGSANIPSLNVSALNGLTPIGGKYSQTGGDVTVEDTAAATSILNSGQGSLVFAANTLKAGDNYHIKIAGTIDTDGKNEELAFTINLGTTTIFEHGVFPLSDILLEDVKGDFAFELEIDWTLRSEGVAGAFVSNSQFTYNKNDGKADYRGWSSNDDGTIDTTAAHTLTATVDWDSADIDNSLVVKQFVITKTY